MPHTKLSMHEENRPLVTNKPVEVQDFKKNPQFNKLIYLMSTLKLLNEILFNDHNHIENSTQISIGFSWVSLTSVEFDLYLLNHFEAWLIYSKKQHCLPIIMGYGWGDSSFDMPHFYFVLFFGHSMWHAFVLFSFFMGKINFKLHTLSFGLWGCKRKPCMQVYQSNMSQITRQWLCVQHTLVYDRQLRICGTHVTNFRMRFNPILVVNDLSHSTPIKLMQRVFIIIHVSNQLHWYVQLGCPMLIYWQSTLFWIFITTISKSMKSLIMLNSIHMSKQS